MAQRTAPTAADTFRRVEMTCATCCFCGEAETGRFYNYSTREHEIKRGYACLMEPPTTQSGRPATSLDLRCACWTDPDTLEQPLRNLSRYSKAAKNKKGGEAHEG